MSAPDVRWEGVSHEQIRDWTRDGRGAAVTEQLEARLARVAAALGENSDQVNAALQRVDEWRGDAARVATEAMRVLRDFDDILGHHGTVNTLAAYGQSDNAAWAKANVPPLVDVRAARVPTGTPLDALHATADHQRVLQAARDAEERARQVMREYESMTTTRIAALPPLSPVPSLVVATGDDTVPSGGPTRDGPVQGGLAPEGTRTGDGPGAVSRQDTPPPGPAGVAGPVGRTGVPTAPPAAATRAPATRATTPSAAADPTRTAASAVTGNGSATGNGSGLREVALPDAVAGPLRERGARPVGGLLGAAPGGEPARPGLRGGIVGLPASTARSGLTGAVPGGTRKPGDEDTEHRVRYAVPGSEIFEPDHDDGLLHDPFRPGSYVAPPAIGDDDE